MKNRILMGAMMLTACSSLMAQETYESATIATEDLNGTARYVGMGGALESLGADISTIGTNPAGVGMFRRSWIGFSGGLTVVPETEGYYDGKTVVNFDQAGFVWASKSGEESFINVAFNYHKSRNFNQILQTSGALNGSSLNKMSYRGNYYNHPVTQVDDLLDVTLLKEGNDLYWYNGNDFIFAKKQSGYIGEYDFNISGNYKNRYYWGITVGVKDVHYSHTSMYNEDLCSSLYSSIGDIELMDNTTITGTGYDIKAGVIIRPIETSPFRFGLSFATPIWYKLKCSNYTTLANATSDPDYYGYVFGSSDYAEISNSHEYKMYTPWKFGLSLGHTVGKVFAIGASYEFADYGSINNRVITGYSYDYDTGYYDADSEADPIMNRHTENTLEAVHTLKVGAEYKLMPDLAVRMGYNYVSPMYKKNGVRDFSLNTEATSYASTADYTNWKDTHRFTLGLGYTFDNMTFDMAYQYSSQKGDFYPFQGSGNETLIWNDDNGNFVNSEQMSNPIGPTKVKNDRHQLIMTLAWRL